MHLFLHPFFEAYRGKGNISNVNARYYDKEVIFICKDCLEILKSCKRNTSPTFFDFGKKILIQYFVPVKECNRVMVAHLS